jgi:EAL domain-containing protein (putative c-di-GMP-specific phosphodiesterase class I)
MQAQPPGAPAAPGSPVEAEPARPPRPDRPVEAELDELLASGSVGVAFQPLIDLATGESVGYEALARGPAGTRLSSPAAMFDAAYHAGRVPELDWLCRATAFRAAMATGLPRSVSLFVNSEPLSMRAPCPAELRPSVAAAEEQLRVVMEVTERALAADPAALLAAVARARAAGWGIALDDVGAHPDSLALMPFVQPDVIKLDLRLIQGRTTAEVARVVNAVLAQAERTGATILGEGIETAQHAEIARAMGATLGQGWLYGRPGALPPRVPGVRGAVPLQPLAGLAGPTPYEVVAAHRPTIRSTKELLLPMSMHMEHKLLDSTEPMVLLACFQHARHFTPGTVRRFARLAERAAFVGAVGIGMGPQPAEGIRGGRLEPGDPLAGEWDVITIGPHFAGALVSRDCGDTGPDRQRRFDFVITHDRELVIRAAQALLGAIVPHEELAFAVPGLGGAAAE